jgi:prepilin-type N-terminal cleavage/methylation domain-containing protein
MSTSLNLPPSPFALMRTRRGLTLVELMIVVAIVGVLAALGGMSYTKYVVKGKLTEMSQWAMDIDRGQEQYFARNSEYYAPLTPFTSTISDNDRRYWTNLLEFDAAVPADVTIQVWAGIGNETCPPCELHDSPDARGADGGAWFAILVENAELDHSIFHHSELRRPIEVTP